MSQRRVIVVLVALALVCCGVAFSMRPTPVACIGLCVIPAVIYYAINRSRDK